MSTCTKKDPVGYRSVHKFFSDYRRILKHIITDEKKKYHDKKFLNASGNPKNTWKIINHKSNELIIFADDTNIFVKGKSKQEVYIEANLILKQLSIYTMLNKLNVNLEKSCFMYFTKTSSNDDNENDNIPPIMIGPTKIKRVSEIKFLGVVIDKKLSWDAHVKSLS